MRGLVERVRHATWRTKVALVLALGAVSAVGVGIAVASGPACDPASMRERTEALEAKYEAMPEPTSAEEQYQRSQQFEKEWMALGELCERPNGMEPEPPLGPEDAEVKHDPPGITSPAPPGLGEGLPGGCKVVNRWLGYVGGDRSRTLGHADDRDRRWADPGAQVGPARRDPGRDPGAERHPAVGDHPRMRFYEPPKRVGPLTIVAERDLVLTLEGPDGERFAFDVSQAEWVEPSV
jgi:hypothetical protein